jgi:hypothetical protein
LPAIYRLYKEIEPEDPISQQAFERWWRWLYLESPAGIGFALGSFDAQGGNLGHIALAPFKFVIDGEIVKAGFSAQLMVAESQRRTLLYPTLIKDLLRTYAAHGCEFCYSEVTRSRVLAANTALGFKKGGNLGVYARPYRLEKIVRQKLGGLTWLAKPAIAVGELIFRIGSPFSGGRIRVAEVADFAQDIEPFLLEMRDKFALAALRSREILNWRFAGNVDRNYQIVIARDGGVPVGYAVVRRMPMKSFDALGIVDILFDLERPAVGHALLRQIHRLAVLARVDLTAIMIGKESPYLGFLRRWGFLPTPETFTIILHEPRNSARRLQARSTADWHVTWFDHDFV